jgi:serine/threonine-protein kinase TTK/MPS1
MKLIDFGIASSIQSDMTSVFKDAQAGTFNYMSPEAVQATHSTDGNQSRYKVTIPHMVHSCSCMLMNKPSNSINGREFLDCLNDHELLKKR